MHVFQQGDQERAVQKFRPATSYNLHRQNINMMPSRTALTVHWQDDQAVELRLDYEGTDKTMSVLDSCLVRQIAILF
jgi:hypothetical protein